ncbi:MAG: hypothetical protein JHC93_01160 [Parachlamydiales bacterium]|nr:hypothetical protein [Parachlamydiales bacterium]
MSFFSQIPNTPRILKVLLWIFASITFIIAIFPKFIAFFSLSLMGIKELYLWQPLTYWLFLPNDGVSFSLLFNLFFNISIFWFAGSSIIAEVGSKSFLRFIAVSSIGSAIVALLTILTTGHDTLINGPTAMIYSMLLVFSMLFANLELRVFFMMSIKAKWLISILIMFASVDYLSKQQYIALLTFWATLGVSYIYAIAAWKLKSPFSLTHFFDNKIANLFNFSSKNSASASKIFDIKTGKSVRADSEFMDAMLAKVARQGKDSLTWKEKWRMRRISKRFRQSQKQN